MVELGVELGAVACDSVRGVSGPPAAAASPSSSPPSLVFSSPLVLVRLMVKRSPLLFDVEPKLDLEVKLSSSVSLVNGFPLGTSNSLPSKNFRYSRLSFLNLSFNIDGLG